MAKKKVRVLDAVVDGKVKDDELEVDAKTADMLVRNGYAELVKEAKKEEPKKDAPKKEKDNDKE